MINQSNMITIIELKISLLENVKNVYKKIV